MNNKTLDFLNLIKKIIIVLVILFLLIFASRAAYDLITYEDNDITGTYNIVYPGEKDSQSSVKNYATKRMEYSVIDGAASAAVLDQKYERIASLVTKSIDFDADQGRYKNIISDNRAVVQTENSRGLRGGRRVELVIGVRPESFDIMQSALSEIGRVTSSTATINDKTYEYRQMMAEKELLERRRASYEDLKGRSGSILEMLQLEEKIIAVDTLIQGQMVSLGEYSDENALCTVNFAMYEGSEAGLSRKLWNALMWSVGVYAGGLGLALFVAFFAFCAAAMWLFIKKKVVEASAAAEMKTVMGAAHTGTNCAAEAQAGTGDDKT